MKSSCRALLLVFALLCALPCSAVSSDAGELAKDASPSVAVVSAAVPGVVAEWHAVATATINQAPNPSGTPSERQPMFALDLATVQIAVYDAVMAIRRTHRPFAATPHGEVDGASMEAAAGEAAYRVLSGLFPSRMATVQPAYEKFLAALPEGRAKELGLLVGSDIATSVLAQRADDGRLMALPPYRPGSAAGSYRGTDPINRVMPSIRPFALTSPSQFQALGPPTLTSADYAADFNETKSLGALDSATRTAAQAEAARFYSEDPRDFWPRNFRQFAMSGSDIAEQARLMAMISVTHADATLACFASKYRFDFWRPESAIRLADTDGNEDTAVDAAWTPLLSTPPHPEYPAGHSCAAGALATVLRVYYGTPIVAFNFTSTVTGTTHRFATVDAFVDDMAMARIAGGVHFRAATRDGAALGQAVAEWELAHNFQRR